jgi:hypothetical protein
VKIKPFRLERWLLKKAEIDLGGGGVTKLILNEVLDELPTKHQMKYGKTDGSDSIKAHLLTTRCWSREIIILQKTPNMSRQHAS